MSRKKLTVYDYLQCKGKRQLSVMFVHNADEAAAAEGDRRADGGGVQRGEAEAPCLTRGLARPCCIIRS